MRRTSRSAILTAIIVGVINIAIYNIGILVAVISSETSDFSGKIKLYVGSIVVLLLTIEGVLFAVRKYKNISLKMYVIPLDQKKSDSSEGFHAFLWVVFAWLLPIFLTKIFLLSLEFEIIGPMPQNEIDLGLALVPYVAFRTFLDWKLYRYARNAGST